MKEFKGTPGSWQTAQNIPTLVTAVEIHRSICTTGNWTESLNQVKVDAENEANAKLIAAAPELLDAVQIMYCAYYDGFVDSSEETLSKVKSIIDKALGE